MPFPHLYPGTNFSSNGRLPRMACRRFLKPLPADQGRSGLAVVPGGLEQGVILLENQSSLTPLVLLRARSDLVGKSIESDPIGAAGMLIPPDDWCGATSLAACRSFPAIHCVPAAGRMVRWL